MDRCSVLVLGPSTVVHGEEDESTSITGLLGAKLRAALASTQVEFAGRELYFGPRMVERALRLVGELKPDVVVYVSNSRPFNEYVVVGRIRRRWPRLYPLAERLAERLRAISGVTTTVSPVNSPRSWIFGVPRWLAVRTIGEEPVVPLADAEAYVRSVIEALLRLEDVGVVFGFAQTCEVSDARSLRINDEFDAAMSAYCAERRVPYHNRNSNAARAGVVPRLSPDGRHADVRTRDLDATALAALTVSVHAMQTA